MAIAVKKDTKTLVAILAVILIVPLLLLVALLWPSSDPVAKKSHSVSPTTTKPEIGKVAAADAVPSTESSSTTTSIPATLKTTPKATTSDSTTASVAFIASATASKTNEQIVQCVSDTYTFSGAVTANKSGTATWTWVRWDGTPTNQSGTATFASDGSTTDVVSPYTFTVNMTPDFTGWIALEVSWNGGNASSPHASFVFSSAAVNSGVVPSGC